MVDINTPASAAARPLVHVLIPVFNGDAFIADAIRSVQLQTYDNWILTVVNNQSKDRTREVVLGLAASDPRIRIHDNEQFLNVIDNHSKAFSLLDANAEYAKILGADDHLMPQCIESLVAVAQSNPKVAMVTSYVLDGRHVAFDGLPFPQTVFSGREVCRMRLLKQVKVFGGPSASLLRASVVRAKQPFYIPTTYHGDNDAYLTILQDHDFGFVHQVLVYQRRGEDSKSTGYLVRVNAYPAADVFEIQKFGPLYLTPDEQRERLATVTDEYYRFLAYSLLNGAGREFRQYHFGYVRGFGVEVSKAKLAWYMLRRLVDMLLNPKRTIESIIGKLRSR